MLAIVLWSSSSYAAQPRVGARGRPSARPSVRMASELSQDRVRLMTTAFLAEALYAGDDELAGRLHEASEGQREAVSPTTRLVESLLLTSDLQAARHTLEEQVTSVALQETSRIVQQLQQDLANEDAGDGVLMRLKDLQLVIRGISKSNRDALTGRAIEQTTSAGVATVAEEPVVDSLPGEACAADDETPGGRSLSVDAVLRAPTMVHEFSKKVHKCSAMMSSGRRWASRAASRVRRRWRTI